MPTPDHEDINNALNYFRQNQHPSPEKATAAFKKSVEAAKDGESIGISDPVKDFARKQGVPTEALQTVEGYTAVKTGLDKENYLHSWNSDNDIGVALRASEFGVGVIRGSKGKQRASNSWYKEVANTDLESLLRPKQPSHSNTTRSSGDGEENSFIELDKTELVQEQRAPLLESVRSEAEALTLQEAQLATPDPEQQAQILQQYTPQVAQQLLAARPEAELDELLLEMFDRA